MAVLHASVHTTRREDWILDRVDRGVDMLITNPELVKTGLDLLDFPTILFLQTGYNVYTLQQSARRETSSRWAQSISESGAGKRRSYR